MRRHSRGFTLLEILIAIAIFAVLILAAQQMFHQAMNQRDQLDRQASRMESQQLLLTWLTQDMEQMVARPVRDSLGDPEPAVQSIDHGIAFTRAGWANPFSLRQRSELQRVEYFLCSPAIQSTACKPDEHNLIRRYWPALDVNQGTEPVDTVMLRNVEDFQVRYLHYDQNSGYQWLDTWPDQATLAQPPLLQALPKSIEINIYLENDTVLHRYYRTVSNPWIQT